TQYAANHHDERKSNGQRPDRPAAHLCAPETDREHGEEMITARQRVRTTAAQTASALNQMCASNARPNPEGGCKDGTSKCDAFTDHQTFSLLLHINWIRLDPGPYMPRPSANRRDGDTERR